MLISVILSHGTLRLDGQPRMSYFVPITDKGRRFAQTFILGGQGFDVWGIEWERLERFAALEEYNLTCLADAEVLYARTPEDLARALEPLLAKNELPIGILRADALPMTSSGKLDKQKIREVLTAWKA